MKKDRSYRKSSIPDHATCVFEGVLFDTYQWEQELYDGSKTAFEKLVRPDTVVVVPILANGTIVVIEDSQPTRPTVTTFPGGRVDDGEDVAVAAARELLEETGLSAETMSLYHEYQPEEKIDWSVYIFIARGCNKLQDPIPGAGERVTVKEVSFDKFIDIALGDFRGELWHERVLEAKLDPAKMTELKKLFQQV